MQLYQNGGYLVHASESELDMSLFRTRERPIMRPLFIQHGSKLKRIKVGAVGQARNVFTVGLATMAARFAAKKGWSTVWIVIDSDRGYQTANTITFVNQDQILNMPHRLRWTNVRPVLDLEVLDSYLV